MKVKCTVPVQIYDPGLTGIYHTGQVVEGEKAAELLDRYPQYFVAEPEGSEGE